MAMTPERRVKAQVRKVLDKLGAYYVMPVTGGQASNVEPGAVTAWAIKF